MTRPLSRLQALVLGVIAVITPTTNWDSLTYHLPRVMHWIQQQSVEHYPADNTCQLEFGPWAAFVVTNLHLLEGNDQWDNLVQWFAVGRTAYSFPTALAPEQKLPR